MRRAGMLCILIAAAALSLGGCIGISGGSSRKCVMPTVGQELMDLKVARDTGAMSDHEYQQARARLVHCDRCPKCD